MDTTKLLRKGETVTDVTGCVVTVLATALDIGQRRYLVRVTKDGKTSDEWISQALVRSFLIKN